MKTLIRITYGTAILLAFFQGGVSTYGLTKFAPGAEFVIAIMGILFEVSKLVIFAMMHKKLPLPLKGALLSVGLVLMGLNILGVSGFLSNSFEKKFISAHAVNHTAEVEATSNIATLERRLASAEQRIDKAHEQLGKSRGDRDQIRAINALISTAQKERDDVAGQLSAAQTRSAKTAGAEIEASGEFAAIVFASETFKVPQEEVIHFAFLLVGGLGDVLEVLLIIAAGFMSRAIEVPVETVEEEAEPVVNVREIAARKGAETRRINKLISAKQRELATRKGVETRKRNAKAKVKAAKAYAQGPKLVAKPA